MRPLPNLQERQQIFDSVTRIKQLTQQPSDFLTDLLVQQQQFTCIEWIHQFGLLAHIPLPPSSISYSDAADKIEVPESTLRAVARMAMTANLLGENEEGELVHNLLSVSLIQDESLAAWFSYLVKGSVPCMRAFPEATQKWPGATKRNETAYNIAMNTDLSFFEHLKANPELSLEFGRYMKSQSTVHAGTTADHLLKGYDWASVGAGKVVDVGGNSGSVSIALAKGFPELCFVVQDQAEPIRGGPAQLDALPKSIAERIEFQEHNFFHPQPVKDADIYLLRMIIHDWADDDAVKIIGELAKVLKIGSRIIIMDMVLPKPGTASTTFEAALRQKDLMMREVMNAKEREVEDWYSLVGKVDKNLEIRAIRRPEGSQHSVIEIAHL